MRLNNFIEGLQILQKYFDDPTGYHIGAEHDVFYVWATDKEISEEDYLKLKDLNWRQENLSSDDPYDPDESWYCWT